ncbi:hypothetical protein G6M89_00875 [Natronolimnobius sp. AArcel1]|uniref:hypothetical protein n=1 Tax=Natronolimnobius sp. AArcel1 TaxID=1679093 RepID=UPI0013EDE62D|nr:hypothetical protein [Natronolimnobius sp. AArcel1]NGM67572.1 hypothetical protein [Natronolimnobius sp. AArcel1]
MLTADHVIPDGEGATVYQDSNFFGTATSYGSEYLDYRLVERERSGISMDCTVEHDGVNEEFHGHATNMEALDHDGETIYKTGISTGYTSGELDILDDDFANVGAEAASGDSGGPLFYYEDFPHPVGTGAVIVGMTIATLTTNDSIECAGEERQWGPGTTITRADAIADDDDDIMFDGCDV